MRLLHFYSFSLVLSLYLCSGVSGTAAKTSEREDEKINYLLLRNVICSLETQGMKNPDFAVGTITRQTGGLPWGRCQLKYWTAVNAGFSLSRNPGDLFLEEVNREFALRIILKCAKDLKRKKLRISIESISHCYSSGRKNGNPNSPYTKTIRTLYSQEKFHGMFQEMSQIEMWLLDELEKEEFSLVFERNKKRGISVWNKFKIVFILFFKGEKKGEANGLRRNENRSGQGFLWDENS